MSMPLILNFVLDLSFYVQIDSHAKIAKAELIRNIEHEELLVLMSNVID